MLEDDFRELASDERTGSDVGADDGGWENGGDVGVEAGLIDCGCEGVRCCFLCFFRGVSVPLASDILGEPERLRVLEAVFFPSGCLPKLLETALASFVEMPEGWGEDLGFPFSGSDGMGFFSSSFLRSSSFRRSVSVSSDSLCVTIRILHTFQSAGTYFFSVWIVW